jgi:hypothetical protein
MSARRQGWLITRSARSTLALGALWGVLAIACWAALAFHTKPQLAIVAAVLSVASVVYLSSGLAIRRRQHPET